MSAARSSLVAVVHFVDTPFSFRAVVRGKTLVLRSGRPKDGQADVRIWVHSADWSCGLLGVVSLRRLRGDGRLLAEGRPSALSLFFDALDLNT